MLWSEITRRPCQTSRTPPAVSPNLRLPECLKRLADRYLNDPFSQVDTLRMGLTSSGRLRVMIVLDIDI